MEGAIDADAPLDYAAFRISRECASYEVFVSGQGKTEKLGSGLLEHLLVHLPAAKDHPSGPGGLLKLELPEGLRGASWFSKHTFERFLHIVGAPELLKAANTIENEMSQLEEARMFHLNLYAKGDRVHSGNGAKGIHFSCLTDLTYMESTEPPLEHKVQTTLSDATKNELLRAMDLRLTASRGELVNAFNRVTGATCSTKQITNLAAFVQHFGAADLRSSLLKYLALVQNNQPDDKAREPSAFSHNTKSGPGKITEEMALAALPVLPTSVSPAKIAQAERHTSTESDNSSNSSNEGESPVERSRPVIRSATPRRSASPMRRIQIGRSGSRRSPALTIKSLSYIPARDKLSSYRDDAGNSSDDAEHVQPPKKPESLVRRMSVQDAINLFESKQRDQRLDLQKQRSSAEISTNTKKSVLRRWSAGTSDCSSTQCPPENSSYSDFPVAAENSELKPGQENQSEVKPESDSPSENPLAAKTSEKDSSFIEQNVAASPTNGPEDSVPSKAEEIHDRLTASAEWNRQKEAELNQMLMKMMENKPVRNRNMVNANGRNQEVPGQEHSGERRGGFYDHYREKRDQKLRGENAGKRAEKEAQFKAMQDVLDQRKAEMARKNTVATGKQESPVRSQKLMRNSSPTLTKREGPKPSPKSTGSRKVLPKTSPLPATRNSWPSAASPRTSGLGTAKISGGISNAGTTPNRRKPQPVPSPTRSSTKTEKPHQQQKGIKGESADGNRSLKAKVEKKEQVVKKSSKIVKTLAASGDDSGTVPAKPSFYSKVTKKGSVVPLESKPFLRKGTGIGPGVGPVIVKTKASQSDDTSKNNSIVIQVQEGAISGTEMLVQQPEGDVAQSEMVSIDPETPVKSIQNCEIMEISEKFTSEAINCVTKEDEFPVETPASEKSTISASAWVEIEETQEFPVSRENGPLEMTIPEAIVAPAALASPRVRHSLSQMLQADSGESEIIEWGNAENPPAMVYQKDAPKGLKRLLKFARKSRGEAMLTDSTSMLVFSEGEEDGDEPKAVGKRNVEALLRKGGLQEKGFLQHKAMFGGSYDGEHSSKKTVEYAAVHEFLPGQSSLGSFAAQSSSHKSREGQMSTTATSTKGSRSFFSLSTFRKSSDTKLR